MIELKGKYNIAKVFTNNVEETAVNQIIELCDQEFVKGSKIRIMPDTHAGAGCTIGTTMTIQDKVVPNLVGVDIGCGMTVAKLNITAEEINFDKLDTIIRNHIPSGFNIHSKAHPFAKKVAINQVKAPINIDRAEKSIGTLGGGNHFCEVNLGNDGSVYLVIHSGSRHLGKQIAEYYQNMAYERLLNMKSEKDLIIAQLKAEGRESEIHTTLRSMETHKIKKELAYLESDGFAMYMHDMKIAQEYANLNREVMIFEIVKKMNWEVFDLWQSVHNFIDMKSHILRKGATSANKGEQVLIPINMRDGSIIATGKGKEDWNFSAPHGAGRLMSRAKAKEVVKLEDFQDSMKNVWTTSVSTSTLDESPFVYKPMQEIIDNIQETVEIVDIIRPLYNFKAN